jgi:hypothetical protein
MATTASYMPMAAPIVETVAPMATTAAYMPMAAPMYAPTQIV